MKFLKSANLAALLFTCTAVSKFIAYADQKAVNRLKLSIYDQATTTNLAARADHNSSRPTTTSTATVSATIHPTGHPSSAASSLRVPAILTIPTILFNAIGSIPGALADVVASASNVVVVDPRVVPSSPADPPLCCVEWSPRGCKKYAPCPSLEPVDPPQAPNDLCCYKRGCAPCPPNLTEIGVPDVDITELIALEKEVAATTDSSTPIWCCLPQGCIRCGSRPRLAHRRPDEDITAFLKDSNTTSVSGTIINTTSPDNDHWCCDDKSCYPCTETPPIYIENRAQGSTNSTAGMQEPQRNLPSQHQSASSSLRVPRIFVLLNMLSRSLISAQFLGQTCNDCSDPQCELETASLCPHTNRTKDGHVINESRDGWPTSPPSSHTPRKPRSSAASSLRVPYFLAFLASVKKSAVAGLSTNPNTLIKKMCVVCNATDPSDVSIMPAGSQVPNAAGWPATDSAATALRLPWLFAVFVMAGKAVAAPIQLISRPIATPDFEVLRKQVVWLILGGAA